jgi:hypothetical protein
MAFKTTLKLNGAEPSYDVLNCSFSFNRSTDHKGRPSSEVYGGELNLVVEAYEDTKIIEMMLNGQNKPSTGEITFSKGNDDGELKKITFKDGYVTNYSESIDSMGSSAGVVSIVITAREIKIGDNATHVNNWPGGHA